LFLEIKDKNFRDLIKSFIEKIIIKAKRTIWKEWYDEIIRWEEENTVNS
jgi:hypothetical protein